MTTVNVVKIKNVDVFIFLFKLCFQKMVTYEIFKMATISMKTSLFSVFPNMIFNMTNLKNVKDL